MRLRLLAFLAALCACESSRSPSDVVAWVNGQPIRESEVLAVAKDPHQASPPDAEKRQQAVESAIEQELAAQSALALGLPMSPDAEAELRALEARVRAVTRRSLARAYLTRNPRSVSQQEAKAYYDAHPQRFGYELKVAQVLKHSRAEIDPLASRIAGGESFEKVAASQFSVIPTGQRPWELDYLKWPQVPEAWWSELEHLSIGQSTGVIAGPGGRYWLLQLLDRRPSTLSFESLKPTIASRLQAQREESERTRELEELREKARIERTAVSASAR